MSSKIQEVVFLVVGGGIAGVTCAETLSIYAPNQSVLVLTESSIVKTVANLESITRYLHRFEVVEEDTATGRSCLAKGVHTLVDQLRHVDADNKIVYTMNNRMIQFRFLCLCTGARPCLIDENNPRVLGIRDTDSVLEFQKKLKDAEKIVIVGNGGIASELAYELENVEVHWVIKDNHIASNFVDQGAAYFFEQSMKREITGTAPGEGIEGGAAAPSTKSSVVKRLMYSEFATSLEDNDIKKGAALGPDWHKNFDLQGKLRKPDCKLPNIHYGCVVDDLENLENGLKVTLSNGEIIECDFLVSATGVVPRHEYSCEPHLKIAHDGGIAVNEMMETSIPSVYAAGDCCTAAWPLPKHWFQMRLWTQARQMGSMAGRAMAATFKGEKIYQDFSFELFGHTTKLFGYDVVLLGRYNSQGLDPSHYLLLRTTPSFEYIKFVVDKDVLVGAILIGTTDLAETCENLILNEINIAPFGEDILNPAIDIEDFFD